jgi:hypothetical protein
MYHPPRLVINVAACREWKLRMAVATVFNRRATIPA